MVADVTALATLAEAHYWDDDDESRLSALDDVVSKRNVLAVVYPTHPEPDILKVFLGSDRGPLFACVLVSTARLRSMLKESPWVVEGFSFQVAASEHLSVEAVRAAVQTWIERTFPDRVLPDITVKFWTRETRIGGGDSSL